MCMSTELTDRAITRVVPRIIRPCFLGAFFYFLIPTNGGLNKMKASEIRSKWLTFFESKGHKIEPSASLVPHNDPSLALDQCWHGAA